MNTEDRELLELAAKAIGLELKRHPWGGIHPEGAGVYHLDTEGLPCFQWNPLIDDGDALRLAAMLRLQILPGKHHGDGCSVNPTHHNTPGVTSFVDSKNMAEQMRRGITWAAAEIGRGMS